MPSESVSEPLPEPLSRATGPPGPGHDTAFPGRRELADRADQRLAGLLAQATGVDGTGDDPGGVALVAMGGYGRRELSPGSDLDVLLLHDGRTDVEQLAERVWYPLWDANVRLDHSVRTFAETRRLAARDLAVQLGLLDARHVAGDATLTERLRAAALADWRAHALRRLPELRSACAERAVRAGEVAFLVEPDLKYGRGGLRDALALRAVAASWLADPPHGRLEAARERLLDVRDALHRVTARATDRLVLQEQDSVARALGLLDGDALLRVVAESARVISYAADVTWRRVDQVVAARRRRFARRSHRRAGPPRAPLADGVVEQGGEVVLARDADPSADPVLVLRTAAAAAQAGLPLSPHAVDRLAAESAPMPEPWPGTARDAIVTLLGAGPAAVPVWEALDQAGIVTRLLPDWERVRNRPQRNPVHRHTVDRHLVETAARAAALTRRVSRPDLLLVGALLHDIGKGWPGDHSARGEAIVADVAPRMGFGPRDTAVLAKLVRDHLLLVRLATRRDLGDPVTIEAVVEAVGSVEALELLHALSEADGLATGPTAWNGWRAGLVEELVGRAAAALHGRPPRPAPAVPARYRRLAGTTELTVTLEPAENGATVVLAAPDRMGLLALVAGVLSLHRLEIRSATTETMDGTAVQVWSVAPEYGRLPDPTAIREDLRRAVGGGLDVDARLARRRHGRAARPGTPAPAPRVEAVCGASRSATVIEVRAHDEPGLLYRIGRALASCGVDVRRARVSTLGAEAVDAFYVVDQALGDPLSPERSAEVTTAVRAALMESAPRPDPA